MTTKPDLDKLAKSLTAALKQQMEDISYADLMLPSNIHRAEGRVWLEGWFDIKAALRDHLKQQESAE